jgi:excisionase family DNA binding protein
VTAEVPYGQGTRMLMLAELCKWLNITEGHARKLVARDAIPYRKIGHLLRFPEAEVEAWSRPQPHPDGGYRSCPASCSGRRPWGRRVRYVLPKSLIEWPTDQESQHGHMRSA